MIELTKETFVIQKRIMPYYVEIKLYNVLSLSFRKHSTGEFLSWRLAIFQEVTNLDISHKGKFTWHSVKRTLERYLNYENSNLKHTIVKEAFK